MSLFRSRIEAGVAPHGDVGRTFLEFRDQLAPADRNRCEGYVGSLIDGVSLHQRHDAIMAQIRRGDPEIPLGYRRIETSALAQAGPVDAKRFLVSLGDRLRDRGRDPPVAGTHDQGVVEMVAQRLKMPERDSTRLRFSHRCEYRMPSPA